MAAENIKKKELLDIFEKFSTRVDLLPDKQRALVRLFLSSRKYSSLAKAAQVAQATIARRLKKNADRISGSNFIAALSDLGEPRRDGARNSSLPPEKMKILKDYFVNGLSARTIAKNTGLSRRKVEKIIKTAL